MSCCAPTVQTWRSSTSAPSRSSLEVRELSGRHPATRLVLLGHDPAPVECAQLLAFGASACLGRDTQSRDVINAIHLASRGLQVLPRAPASAGAGLTAGRSALLTRREAEVLPLLQQGRLERADRARPAGGRRDGPHPRTQHLPQARRPLPPRARRAARARLRAAARSSPSTRHGVGRPRRWGVRGADAGSDTPDSIAPEQPRPVNALGLRSCSTCVRSLAPG